MDGAPAGRDVVEEGMPSREGCPPAMVKNFRVEATMFVADSLRDRETGFNPGPRLIRFRWFSRTLPLHQVVRGQDARHAARTEHPTTSVALILRPMAPMALWQGDMCHGSRRVQAPRRT
jgi:hypothetical protein